jgi:phosphonate degradation associated HDIG domain protein
MTVVDEVRELFDGSGGRQYGGERVTQLAHALQCAAAAEATGAAAPLVVAALLHDVGHLIHDLGPRPAERGIDDRHEVRGAQWLARWFGPEVTEPVRLHVPAKRYLCALEPGYFQGLSPASVRSLALQGGPFDAKAEAAFIKAPHAADAVRLRRWDEAAKVAGLATPDLAHYADALRACLRG